MICVSRKLVFVQADSFYTENTALINCKNKEAWSTDISTLYTVTNVNKVESKEIQIYSATAICTETIRSCF
jgi:hypothetical protein